MSRIGSDLPGIGKIDLGRTKGINLEKQAKALNPGRLNRSSVSKLPKVISFLNKIINKLKRKNKPLSEFKIVKVPDTQVKKQISLKAGSGQKVQSEQNKTFRTIKTNIEAAKQQLSDKSSNAKTIEDLLSQQQDLTKLLKIANKAAAPIKQALNMNDLLLDSAPELTTEDIQIMNQYKELAALNSEIKSTLKEARGLQKQFEKLSAHTPKSAGKSKASDKSNLTGGLMSSELSNQLKGIRGTTKTFEQLRNQIINHKTLDDLKQVLADRHASKLTIPEQGRYRGLMLEALANALKKPEMAENISEAFINVVLKGEPRHRKEALDALDNYKTRQLEVRLNNLKAPSSDRK